MKISIIIPVFARTSKDYIKLCLESIHKYSKEKHEIIVCVNPALNIEGYEDLSATYIIASDVQGQWHANNLMARKASNEWIMLIDDDTVLPLNWEEIFEHLESDVVSMNCMEPDWTHRGIAPPFVHYDCGKNPQEFNWDEFEKKSMELREEKMEQGYSYPFLFKKSLWEKVGGWNEEMDPWGSNGDSDFQHLVNLAGVTPMRWRGVLAYHFSMQSGTFTLPEADPYLARNRRLFEQKWGIVRAGSPEIWYNKLNLPNPNLRFRPSWMDPKFNV